MGVIIVTVQAGRVADDVFAPVVVHVQHIQLVGGQVEAGVADFFVSIFKPRQLPLGVLGDRARDAVGAFTATAADLTQVKVCRSKGQNVTRVNFEKAGARSEKKQIFVFLSGAPRMSWSYIYVVFVRDAHEVVYAPKTQTLLVKRYSRSNLHSRGRSGQQKIVSRTV